MSKAKILYSVPSQTHIALCLDEVEGLEQLGYPCAKFSYHARDGYESKLARLWIIVQNALNLVKIAHKFKPDIVYFNSRLEVKACTRDYITLKIFKSLYHRKVLILFKSHGSELDTLKDKSFFMGSKVLPFLKKHISGWLFLSSEEKSKLGEIGYLDLKKVFITKNIVRAWQFAVDDFFKSRHGIPQENKVLLFVGRIVEVKGIHDVVAAFKKIIGSYPATLIIVGDGGALDEVKKSVSELNLTNQVIFTGRISETEVVEFYSNSDVLVFPTYDQEGFPMALFNSVAAGISIVTTPIRAATDYLSEPDNCLWVKAQDSESIFQAVTRLLETEGLKAKMRANNLQKSQLFSKETVCEELSLIIETVIKQNSDIPD